MTAHEAVIAKVAKLPEPLAQEVSDFVDFLLMRRDSQRWDLWSQFNQTLSLAESDFSDYLPHLEEYENKLARGEVNW